MSNLDQYLHGLNYMSIDEAKKRQKFQSWKEARDFATGRISDLELSLKVFKKMIKDGVPWWSDENSTPESPDATRN
jgi:hypothetical protein